MLVLNRVVDTTIQNFFRLLNIQEIYFGNRGHIGFIRITRKLNLLRK